MLINVFFHRFNATILLFLALTPALSLHAQVASILSGRVLDRDSQAPLEYASVALFSAGDTVLVAGGLTGEDGRFELRDIAAGKYYLEARFIGYELQTRREIDVPGIKQAMDIGDIHLTLGSEVLGEVEVRGARNEVSHTLEKQVYRADQFQAAVGGSAVDVLRNMPSLSVNAEGEILLRGTTGFIVLLDGKPVMGEAAAFLSQLPANAIANIEMVTSPSARYDPDGKAGIINIITKKGSTDGIYLLINGQLGAPSIETFGNEKIARRFGGDFTSNIRRGRWDISVGADYKRNDITGYRDGVISTTLNGVHTSLPSGGERSHRRESYSARAAASFAMDDRNTLSASVFGGRRSELRTADLLYNQTRTLPDQSSPYETFAYYNKNLRERRGDFLIASMDYQHLFQDKSSLTASALYERTVLGGPTNNLNVIPENHRDTLEHHIMEEYNPLDGFRMNIDYTLPLTETASLEAGYQYRYLMHVGEFSYNVKVPGTPDFATRPEYGGDIDLNRSIHSVFAQYNGSGKRWSYTAGLRLEHTDRELEQAGGTTYTLNKWYLFPAVNAMYEPGNGYQVKIGYSRRIERTTTSMMNPFMARRHSEVLEEGDPELLPELIDAAELGLVKAFGANSVFANVYYRHTSNAINRVNSVYNDSTLYRTYTNTRGAQAYGVEAGVELAPLRWWKLYAGGNVYQYAVEGRIFGEELSRNSVNYSFNVNTTVNFTQTLNAQLSVNYLSRTATIQGENSRLFSPNLSIRKSVLNNRGAFTLQWMNMGMGWLDANQQRMTTRGQDFYFSTNYINEVDMVLLNFTYRLNELGRTLKFSKSEFGDKEF